MNRLDRYIFREVLTPTLIALIALTFVMVGRELSALLELVVRRSATGHELFSIVAAIVPGALIFTIPTAVLVGVLTGFGRLSSDSEAVAFRAAGLSMITILRPVLTLGILAWGVNSILSVWIAPTVAANLGQLTRSIGIRQLALELQPRVFNEDVEDLVLYVQDISPDGAAWRGILLADLGDPDEPRVTFAESGRLVSDPDNEQYQVTLLNGSTHVVSPLAPDRYASTRFGTLTLPVPISAEPTETVESTPLELSTRALWRAVQADEATYAEQVEFHRRLALPFASIAFALIGFPLGLSTNRGGRSMGLVVSAALMLIYYMVFIGGTQIAGNAQMSPFLGTWGANLGFLLLGVILLLRSEREHGNRATELLLDAGKRLRKRYSSLRGRPHRVSQWAYSLTRHPTWFRTLDLYVLKSFSFFFFLVLVVFVSMFVIVTLFELLPDIVENRISLGLVTSYFFYLLPQILYWVVPLAVLVAVLINMGTLTKANETLAVKAGAISLYRLSAPLLLTGLLLSSGIYVMQDFLLPYTNQRQDEFRNRIKGRPPQTYRDPLRKWMAGSNNHIYYYNYFDPERNFFPGISVFEFDTASFSLLRWTFAEQANWTGQSWAFSKGWTASIDSGGQVDDYDSFERLDYSQISDNPDYFKKEVLTASQMNYPELSRYIDDLSQSGFDVSGLTVDLYRKLSFPLVSIIMVIIAIPFSFATGRRGSFYGIGISIVIGISYWAAFELFDKLGGINQLSPLIAAWFPNLIFGLSGFWLLLRVRT